MINPVDREALRKAVRDASPFPFFSIDGFLEEGFAREVEASFPSFEEALVLGEAFEAVNERRKIQIPDSSRFPAPIAKLHELLASREWLDLLSDVMGIPKLMADPDLVGGGIHETKGGGHLDVHVDFNYIAERDIHRRLNILLYFNPRWEDAWGGNIELWDQDVKECHHSFAPVFNRCVVFETSNISYHGVQPVTCPEDVVRKSFAGYYYTAEAPDHWQGEAHSTIFRARPDERWKGMVLMPLERMGRRVGTRVRGVSKRLFGT